MNYPAASCEVSKTKQEAWINLEASFGVLPRWAINAAGGVKFGAKRAPIETFIKNDGSRPDKVFLLRHLSSAW